MASTRSPTIPKQQEEKTYISLPEVWTAYQKQKPEMDIKWRDSRIRQNPPSKFGGVCGFCRYSEVCNSRSNQTNLRVAAYLTKAYGTHKYTSTAKWYTANFAGISLSDDSFREVKWTAKLNPGFSSETRKRVREVCIASGKMLKF